MNLAPVLYRQLGANETIGAAKPELTIRSATVTMVQFAGRNYSIKDEAAAGTAKLRLVDTDMHGLLISGNAPSPSSASVLTPAQQAAVQ